MARTWYDDGGVPREEWGALPPQMTDKEMREAEGRLSAYLKAEDKKREAIYDQKREEVLRRADYYEDTRYEMERNERLARQQEEAEQQKREERKQRLAAVRGARKRYESKSALSRFFTRKLTDKRAQKMTTDEINNLYGGVEEEKGMSR